MISAVCLASNSVSVGLVTSGLVSSFLVLAISISIGDVNIVFSDESSMFSRFDRGGAEQPPHAASLVQEPPSSVEDIFDFTPSSEYCQEESL